MTTAVDRRSQILAVATRLFSEHGYAGTTLDDVAAEIGFTKPAIYHWFASKDEILFEIHRAIVQPALDGVRAITNGPGAPAEHMRRILSAHVSRVMENTDANRVFAVESHNLSADRAAEIDRLDRDYEVAVRSVYAAGVAAGEFTDVDPVVAVAALLSACSWVHNWYRADGPLSATDVLDMLVELFQSGFLIRAGETEETVQ